MVYRTLLESRNVSVFTTGGTHHLTTKLEFHDFQQMSRDFKDTDTTRTTSTGAPRTDAASTTSNYGAKASAAASHIPGTGTSATNTVTMMIRRNMPLILGLGVALGGYYMYRNYRAPRHEMMKVGRKVEETAEQGLAAVEKGARDLRKDLQQPTVNVQRR